MADIEKEFYLIITFKRNFNLATKLHFFTLLDIWQVGWNTFPDITLDFSKYHYIILSWAFANTRRWTYYLGSCTFFTWTYKVHAVHLFLDIYYSN